MISLAKFTLLQSDDLSLAEVLKGPLFSFSEEMLFEVSYGRREKRYPLEITSKRKDQR